MKFEPHPYQDYSIKQILECDKPGLLIGMGLGKTVSALTAANLLLFDSFEIDKPLIIAPKKVAESTWPDEIAKWDHLKHLKLSIIAGNERQRKEALLTKADMYVVSRDNIAWLVAHYQSAFPFDMLIVDESSSFKNPDSRRFKALKQIRSLVKRVVILTGTPTPNGLIDLWSQIYLLDQGERLGKTITGYRDKYFLAAKRKGDIIYSYAIKKDETEIWETDVNGRKKKNGKLLQAGILGNDVYEKEIYDKIRDICVSMKAEDYLDLPKRIDRNIDIRLSPEVLKQYYDFERDEVMKLTEATEITAVNAAALSTKLLQFANGAIYDEKHQYHEIHNEKIDALIEDVEAANGQSMLVFYQYKHDLERIQKHLRSYKPVVLKGTAEINDWNQGKISLLLAHAASAGHGLNLQDGGHLLDWFGCPWSLELYLQAVARLDRQGQKYIVVNGRLMCAGTIDMDVLAALENKDRSQNALLAAVKARIAKYSV